MTKKQFYKHCRWCNEYFPSEFLSIEKYCPKCRDEEYTLGETRQWWWINHIKNGRGINLNTFDMYDLSRPLKTTKGYERVCRFCGDPLFKMDGSYSPGRRYCNKGDHNGDTLFGMFNWGWCRDKYLIKVQKQQKKMILEEIKKQEIDIKKRYYFILCEECGKFCTKRANYYGGSYYGSEAERKLESINVHHKIPVHTLTEGNIMLIFDDRNFICLCEECHKKQDHRLSKITKVETDKNKKITDWFKK